MKQKFSGMTFTSITAVRKLEAIKAFIEHSENGASIEQMCVKFGMSGRIMLAYASHLHMVEKKIYVASWIKQRTGIPLKVFKIGNREDAPRDRAVVASMDGEDEILPVRRVAKNVKPRADDFPVVAAFWGRLAA